jgi:hypothetical protein
MSNKCHSVSDEKLAQMKENEKKKNQAKQNKTTTKANEKKSKAQTKKEKQTEQQKSKAYKRCVERAAKVVEDDICKLDSPNERMAVTAKKLAWPYGTSSDKYYNYATSEYKKAAKETGVPDRVTADTKEYHDHYIGKSCAMYVCVSIAASGVDQGFPGGIKSKRACETGQIYSYLSNSPRWTEVSKPQPGDVIVTNGKGHVATYVKRGNKTVIAQANLHVYFGRVMGSAKWQGSSPYTIFRYTGK